MHFLSSYPLPTNIPQNAYVTGNMKRRPVVVRPRPRPGYPFLGGFAGGYLGAKVATPNYYPYQPYYPYPPYPYPYYNYPYYPYSY
ncbi:hypothetical protein [Pontibacillus yanchengensis]|uniref:Uncharacterized protein n=1 Tax=Pontibacillus yanchengensis Y32 TaxID=1385514 RepID=A0A0A2TA50_9BACI|nr:hypothetical protein [Pontibacillus yanchengensis]KGP70946.1 hypothetical protein N782_02635 [Pontibacillus yanchengensis Y32]